MDADIGFYLLMILTIAGVLFVAWMEFTHRD